jgi:acetyl esterase/lipase
MTVSSEAVMRSVKSFVVLGAIAWSATLVAQAPVVIHLWPNGAPGSEARKDEPEQAKDWWVKNVHNPSLTVFTPAADAPVTHTAIVVAPGGGHSELVFNPEGVEPAQYLAKLGVTAFALKYRLAREPGSTYTLERDTAADIRRAMRLVRTRASEWHVDPNRIGVMGFSAGGEVAAMVAYGAAAGDASAADAIDRASARPNFQIVIYPGSYGVPAAIPPDAPPAFFLAANDDTGPSGTILTLVERYRAAKVPVEVHLFAQGQHAFNMGNRSKLATIHDWPQRMADWLKDNGWLQ